MTPEQDVTLEAFAPWLERWELEADGRPVVTPYAGSRLLPVRRGQELAMLKLAKSTDERRGARVMAWWNGVGAIPVLRHDDQALLMARAPGGRSLIDMASNGDDAGATGIICAVVQGLHRQRSAPAPVDLPPLGELFRPLLDVSHPDARLSRAAGIARRLVDIPEAPVVLHGDIHHGNILELRLGDWRAIDPWGYVGERAYDYANIVRNPDLATVQADGRLDLQIALIAEAAKLDITRLRLWVFAHAGLAAAWDLADSQDPARSFSVLDQLYDRVGG